MGRVHTERRGGGEACEEWRRGADEGGAVGEAEGGAPELCAHSPCGEGCGAATPLSMYGCQPQFALRPHSPAPRAHRRRRSQAVGGAAAATVVAYHRRESAADCPSASPLPAAASPPPQRAPLIPRHRATHRCNPLVVGGGVRRRRGQVGAASGPVIWRRRRRVIWRRSRSTPTTAAHHYHAPLAPRRSRRLRRLSSFSVRPQPQHIRGARGGASVPAAQRGAHTREARKAIGDLTPQPLLAVSVGGSVSRW